MTWRGMLAGIAVGMLLAGQAAAADVSGQQLLSLCTANMDGGGNSLDAAECMGFVVGVAESFSCSDGLLGRNWDNQTDVSQPKMVEIIVRHINAHPTALTKSGSVVVADALAEAFPCRSATASGQ